MRSVSYSNMDPLVLIPSSGNRLGYYAFVPVSSHLSFLCILQSTVIRGSFSNLKNTIVTMMSRRWIILVIVAFMMVAVREDTPLEFWARGFASLLMIITATLLSFSYRWMLCLPRQLALVKIFSSGVKKWPEATGGSRSPIWPRHGEMAWPSAQLFITSSLIYCET